MTNFLNSSQRKKLVKTVTKSFLHQGWTTKPVLSNNCNLVASWRDVTFYILCFDNTILNFRGHDYINDFAVESTKYFLRNGHKQLILVFDRNFFGFPLEKFQDRGLLFFCLDDLSELITLSKTDKYPPIELTKRQHFVLKNNMSYCCAASLDLKKNGDLQQAVKWGKYAVEASTGYTKAHLQLFLLYREIGELEEADKVGSVIANYRGHDKKIMELLRDLASRRGDKLAEAKWHDRLKNTTNRIYSFEDIISKQNSNPIRPYKSDVLSEDKKNMALGKFRYGIGKWLSKLIRS